MIILPYNTMYASHFYDLNVEWLHTYFYVEPYDEMVLSEPEKYILDKGGHIFFAVENDLVIGTVALIPHDPSSFELTKMAVDKTARGKKVGQQLLQHCMEFAKGRGKNLMLYSHTKLENAIHIYRKFGFQEIPLEIDNPYKRSNIKMLLTLNH